MKKIVGLGHLAIIMNGAERLMAFYNGVLVLQEMLRLHHDDGSLFLSHSFDNLLNPGSHP